MNQMCPKYSLSILEFKHFKHFILNRQCLFFESNLHKKIGFWSKIKKRSYHSQSNLCARFHLKLISPKDFVFCIKSVQKRVKKCANAK